MKQNSLNPKTAAYAGLIFVIFVWGLSPLITVYLYKFFSPTIRIAFGTFFCAASMLFISGKNIKLLNKDYLKIAIPTGFFLVVLLPVILFFIFNLVQFFRALFEYQGVKNRLKFKQERGATEELIAQQLQETAKLEADRAKIEAELREKLRAEILENMAKENAVKEENNASDDAVEE